MTNWAPDYTPRGVIHYTSAGLPHTFTGRVARGTPDGTVAADVFSAFDAMVRAMAPLMAEDLLITAMFIIRQDENITIPVTPAPVLFTAGDVPVANFSTVDKATQITFPGKSNAGLKHHVSLFGFNLAMDSTTVTGQTYGRILMADAATVAGAISALRTSNLVANDGEAVSWYGYCTNKVNDYWWKQARRTAGL